MKTNRTIFWKSILCACVFLFACKANAQVYATPELKAQVEKENADKIKSAGLQAPVAAASPDKKESVRPPFDYNLLKGCYRLQKVEAIDHSGTHTAQEMDGFRKEAEGEFAARDWAVNMEKSMIYFVRRKDNTNYRLINFIKEGNTLKETDCKTCKTTDFEIIEQTASHLVIEIKPQDTWQHFMYRFTFDK